MLYPGMSKRFEDQGPTQNGLQNWKKLGFINARILALKLHKLIGSVALYRAMN